jgi:lipopolysaccharide transport system ATP-binding protein
MTAIEAKNLTKVYKVYGSPVDRLKEIVRRRPYHSEFTALDNIDFSVPKGETFGIIGENGAGKSTLLKILARTLKPSSGHLAINGRSAALLELGAGFNPEFTGEENIYLNAYLLGLSKSDIEKDKAKIIDFSELGDFIKRPVKTYSSGMHVRLAFSIATCVNPEILIVDEALSVGDQHFQKKCIDRMMRLREEGKTIFFCSHSMYLVQELCRKAIWLKNGRMERSGNTAKVINAYNDWVRAKETGMQVDTGIVPVATGGTDKEIWIEWIKIADDEGREIDDPLIVSTGRDIWVKILIRVQNFSRDYRGFIGMAINRNDEEEIFGVTTKMDGFESISFYDRQEISIRFSEIPLLSGKYYFVAALSDEHGIHPYDIQRSKMISIENLAGELGLVRLGHEWEIQKQSGARPV